MATSASRVEGELRDCIVQIFLRDDPSGSPPTGTSSPTDIFTFLNAARLATTIYSSWLISGRHTPLIPSTRRFDWLTLSKSSRKNNTNTIFFFSFPGIERILDLAVPKLRALVFTVVNAPGSLRRSLLVIMPIISSHTLNKLTKSRLQLYS